jgi:alkylation response protein AidB-like acyl-CoA dehydrogenase
MAMADNRLFGFTETQRLIAESIPPLLRDVLPPAKVRDLDEASQFPEAAYQALAKGGWMGLPYAQDIGGSGGSYKDLAVFVETVANHNVQLASAWLTSVIYGGMQVALNAPPGLRGQLLPGVIAGTTKLALCITEPDTGSDVSGIRTRAVDDGGDFVITGHKMYITCAHMADHLVVATKTDPEAGHRGISLFLVDAKSPGLTIRPLKGVGRKMIHTNEVFFDGVRVPASRCLGGIGQGWKALMRGLNLERLCLSASAVGNMRRIISYARDCARDRRQFGKPIAAHQAVAHKFAEMQVQYQSSAAMLERCAALRDAGLTPTMDTAVTKVHCTESNSRCADMGIQVMGGAGWMMEHEMQMYWRDSRVGTIGGGTSEIMRNIIAKQMDLEGGP